ncbi:MAG: hypothetical protein KC433_08735 [Anaerolineales bacterium]|nr:hypothetical protein [Anaerolineales bacterium]MCB8939205.1 hypothetical protein [Ardenticatenaceae bacterium]
MTNGRMSQIWLIGNAGGLNPPQNSLNSCIRFIRDNFLQIWHWPKFFLAMASLNTRLPGCLQFVRPFAEFFAVVASLRYDFLPYYLPFPQAFLEVPHCPALLWSPLAATL